jgi:hypothetical protein
MFGPVTFFKGALVLHMLRHVMGDTLFFRAMRRYISETSTRTWRLRRSGRCVSEHSTILSTGFQRVALRRGAPAYDVQLTERRSAQGFEVTVIISQLQDGAVFAMRVDLALHTVRGDVYKVVLDGTRGDQFHR